MQFDPSSTQEEKLVALLAKAKKEPKYSEDFEADFLRAFHVKQTQASTKCSVNLSFSERLQQALNNFGGWNWIYGSMAAVALCAIGAIIAYSPDDSMNHMTEASLNDGVMAHELMPVSDETTQEVDYAQEDSNKNTPKPTEEEKEVKSESPNE